MNKFLECYVHFSLHGRIGLPTPFHGGRDLYCFIQLYTLDRKALIAFEALDLSAIAVLRCACRACAAEWATASPPALKACFFECRRSPPGGGAQDFVVLET